MLPAAVQEERQRNREREGEAESTSVVNEEMPVEKILEAEMAVEQKTELHTDEGSGGSSVSRGITNRLAGSRSSSSSDRLPVNICFLQPNDPVTNICQAADKQLFTLVEWAKRIPHFSELALDDQVILLRAGESWLVPLLHDVLSVCHSRRLLATQ